MRGGPPPLAIDDPALIRVLKALGDGTRFRMVQEIAAAGELACGQVAARFDVSQPTVSHHLKILMDAGVLVMRTAGKHHFTSVNRPLLSKLGKLLPARFAAPRDPLELNRSRGGKRRA
jgi:ArsR family transcriptional regulator, arsenate/arsenite/antimonite-responsive transcriptional repressor